MPPPRVHKVDLRLDPEIILRLVADYGDGTPTTVLTQRYTLGKGTVLKLLRERGVAIRRQGFPPHQVTEAGQLYQSGLSLARLGARYGRSPTVVRKALLDAGITMRPRRGSS